MTSYILCRGTDAWISHILKLWISHQLSTWIKTFKSWIWHSVHISECLIYKYGTLSDSFSGTIYISIAKKGCWNCISNSNLGFRTHHELYKCDVSIVIRQFYVFSWNSEYENLLISVGDIFYTIFHGDICCCNTICTLYWNSLSQFTMLKKVMHIFSLRKYDNYESW